MPRPVMSGVRHLCSTETWLFITACEPTAPGRELPNSQSCDGVDRFRMRGQAWGTAVATLAGVRVDEAARRATASRQCFSTRGCEVEASLAQSECSRGFEGCLTTTCTGAAGHSSHGLFQCRSAAR